jgi:hypothetical protein
VQAIALGRKCRHRRGALETVAAEILARKIALPGIGHVFAAGREFIAPSEFGAVEAAARGEFPFGLPKRRRATKKPKPFLAGLNARDRRFMILLRETLLDLKPGRAAS